MLKKINGKYGFTLVEVMLVMGVLGIITGLAIPFYQSFQISSALDNTGQEIIQALRNAQSKAISSQELSSHGVHFDTNQFVVFKGNIYSPADPDNEIFEVANTVDISSSGSNNIVFSVGQGLPDTQPVITITSSNNESKSINLNELGRINVY
ncbi:MAG: prepilin-type N-terminal cleavage/methylation domain-containing protein [Candidatus Daviesbacteria bacterium]|nr:prepilin-type N-terminal cleavage/methylation domain-containing protein [Candidatus Daviesbacteria bacterium]